MTDQNRAESWWHRAPQRTRDDLNALVKRTPLALDEYPHDNPPLCGEIDGWVRLGVEILDSHVAHLEQTKARIQAAGREWTTAEYIAADNQTK